MRTVASFQYSVMGNSLVYQSLSCQSPSYRLPDSRLLTPGNCVLEGCKILLRQRLLLHVVPDNDVRRLALCQQRSIAGPQDFVSKVDERLAHVLQVRADD